jgi:hypothetical protein
MELAGGHCQISALEGSGNPMDGEPVLRQTRPSVLSRQLGKDCRSSCGMRHALLLANSSAIGQLATGQPATGRPIPRRPP